MSIRWLVEEDIFPYFSHARYNFRRSITDPNSNLRKVLEIVRVDRVVNRLDFYMETRLHANGDFNPFFIDRVRGIRLRKSWNSSFWSALCEAGILKNSGTKNENGYFEYVPGPQFTFYVMMAQYFTKTEVRQWWNYSGHFPKGCRVVKAVEYPDRG